MATNYGVNATKALVTKPMPLAAPGEGGGGLKCIYDIFTLTADLSAADIILMGCMIPAGARIVDAMIKFADLDSGSTGTLDVGYQASADAVEAAVTNGLFAAVDVHSAADVLMAHDNAASPATVFKKLASAVQPVITVNGDTNATTGSIELIIYYILN